MSECKTLQNAQNIIKSLPKPIKVKTIKFYSVAAYYHAALGAVKQSSGKAT